MTNYNERLDKILLDNLQKMSEDVQAFGILDCKNYLPEYKQAITSLIKEMVAEAKPELKGVGKQIPGDMDSFLHNQEAIWSEQYVTEFEQSLLKELESKSE